MALVFLLPLYFMISGSLRNAGLPPPTTPELVPSPLFVYREAFEYFRYGYAAAVTVTMFVVTLLIVLIQWLIIRRWRHAFVV